MIERINLFTKVFTIELQLKTLRWLDGSPEPGDVWSLRIVAPFRWVVVRLLINVNRHWWSGLICCWSQVRSVPTNLCAILRLDVVRPWLWCRDARMSEFAGCRMPNIRQLRSVGSGSGSGSDLINE
eukprot:GHVO01031321.1.p2 GENE.GHVO01031321.1~~GHVO01031321.1.p2  ORF type:complete len:126 (+),score=2.77 GHVO01031321.1:502-879(+)